MSPCRRQNSSARRQAGEPAAQSGGRTARTGTVRSTSPQAAAEPAVRRYVHPIQTARPCRRSPTEELLGQILESLSRQSELLEELLRRTESNDPDTKV